MACESADGVYVYYTQTPGLRVNDLWRIHTAGGQPIKVLEGVWARHFVMLESGIYYMAAPSGNARLSGDAVLKFFSFATGRSTTVARNLGPLGNGPTASADGRTILYVRADTRSDLMLVDNFR
jgi:hypothetical protein